MFRLALALLSVLTLPAAAIEACSVLNPIEIAATLRGPGVVVLFHLKTDGDHSYSCVLARISRAGSFDENLKRFQSETPLTLTVAVADDLGAKGFDLLKADTETKDTEVPGIGDRALLRRGAKSERLFVSSGSTFLILGLSSAAAVGTHDQDLLDLAREALAANLDGFKVVKYEIAERALTNDRAAFESDPKNFGLFLMAMKKFDEARVYNLRAAALSPDDTDVLYQQGILDWLTAYQPRMEIRAHLGLNPPQSLPAGPACAQVRSANHEKVDEGIADLSKAVKLRPDFDDAMAYLNLMYRERADYECDDDDARASDLKTADNWIGKTFFTKRANIGKNNGGNVLSLFPPIPAPPPPHSLGIDCESLPRAPMRGVIGGIPSSMQALPSNTAPSQYVRASGGVSSGLLLMKVEPVYPPVARQGRIQGTVVLKAIIGKDGLIEDLSLVSGHPLLVPAAMDAVKQWKYKPYLLNGERVEVETLVQVNFTLAGG